MVFPINGISLPKERENEVFAFAFCFELCMWYKFCSNSNIIELDVFVSL